MSSQQRFMCGVPKDNCTGGNLPTDQHFTTNKCHTSRRDALRCMKKLLLSRGFTQIAPREFVNPDNGYIRILPKQSKFGARLRQGKGEDGARFMPERGSGVVI